MAVQSGVLFFDGRPTDDECGKLAAGLEPLALDGVSTVARAGIAMAFGASHVWTGEEGCPQPLQTAEGLFMTWDGRLDNRDDLLVRLSGRLDAKIADASIAMAVFERWGIDGLRSLIGDWSLAIWDSHTHVLHLARDYMGVRPLYYHVDREAVMWSTSLGELAIRAGRVDDLDEAFAARFMTLQFSTDVTPYIGIRAVPTATCLSFSQTGNEMRQRFWRLEPGTIRYRDPCQYEEHLRALWVEAVGSRLRTTGTVWAELSGGLDSSSVVCMADVLIRARRVPAEGLQPISHVTLESPEGDERLFIAEVEKVIGTDTEIVGVEASEEEVCVEWAWITPLAPRGAPLVSAVRMHRAGGRVLLSGRVGDVTMGCVPDNSVAVFEDFAALRLGLALSNMRRWSRSSQKPFIEIGYALARHAMRAGPVVVDSSGAGVNLLAPHLRSSMMALATTHGDSGAVPLAKREQARQMLSFGGQARLESWPERGSIAEAHPFAHRPLVEYMLSIPAEELSAPGNTRSLMRRAFAGLVPGRILRRTSKGYYPPAALRAARAQAKSLPPVERLESVQRGWIDAQRLQASLRALNLGADTGSDVQLMLRLEQWLASRHRRGPAVIPERKEVTTNDVRIA